MHQTEIQFYSVKQIQDFVNTISCFEEDFRFCTENRMVNAKSVLGVFSIDFSKPLYLLYESDNQRIEKMIGSYPFQKCDFL